MARSGNRKGAFRLEAPDPSEIEIHQSIARYLDAALLQPAEWTSLAVGHGLLTEGETSRLARVGVKSGWPDLVIVWNHKIFGFEIKTRTGKLSRTRIVKTKRGSLHEVVGQQERFALLARAGMPVAVVRSLDDMIVALNHHGIPHQGLTPGLDARGGPVATPPTLVVYGGVNPSSPGPTMPQSQPAPHRAAPAIRVRAR